VGGVEVEEEAALELGRKRLGIRDERRRRVPASGTYEFSNVTSVGSTAMRRRASSSR
jgi:hypothetical protein